MLELNRNILLNLERLRRQYVICRNEYDEASLLDLSHILRIWIDMQNEVNSYLTNHMPAVKFTSYSISKKLKKLCHGSTYFLVAFPGGVTTSSTKTNRIASIGGLQDFKLKDVVCSVTMTAPWPTKPFETVNSVIMVGKKVQLEDNIVQNGFPIVKTDFLTWIKSEAFRGYFVKAVGSLNHCIISREMVIKRVANALGGSHPEHNYTEQTENNKFDPVIRLLMESTVKDTPLPYYILIKIARDILANFAYLKADEL